MNDRGIPPSSPYSYPVLLLLLLPCFFLSDFDDQHRHGTGVLTRQWWRAEEQGAQVLMAVPHGGEWSPLARRTTCQLEVDGLVSDVLNVKGLVSREIGGASMSQHPSMSSSQAAPSSLFQGSQFRQEAEGEGGQGSSQETGPEQSLVPSLALIWQEEKRRRLRAGRPAYKDHTKGTKRRPSELLWGARQLKAQQHVNAMLQEAVQQAEAEAKRAELQQQKEQRKEEEEQGDSYMPTADYLRSIGESLARALPPRSGSQASAAAGGPSSQWASALLQCLPSACSQQASQAGPSPPQAAALPGEQQRPLVDSSLLLSQESDLELLDNLEWMRQQQGPASSGWADSSSEGSEAGELDHASQALQELKAIR